MSTLLEYKCPCCGGAIAFDSASQKLKCPYCDTEFDVETLKSYDEDLKKETPDDMKWQTEAGKEWQEGEAEGMRVYVCDSCGGEARVPFQPREGRPIYCSACYAKMKEEA